jgi:hypothetical protein
MRVAYDWVDVYIRQWRSKDELIGFMRSYGERIGERIFVGTSAEHETEFTLFFLRRRPEGLATSLQSASAMSGSA